MQELLLCSMYAIEYKESLYREANDNRHKPL